MSDTAVIYLIPRPRWSGIYIHTTTELDEWPEALRQALDSPEARREWGDPVALHRIILVHLLETLRARNWGGGMSTDKQATDYPVTICDIPRRIVAASFPGEEIYPHQWFSGTTFGNFVDQPHAKHMIDPHIISIKPRCWA